MEKMDFKYNLKVYMGFLRKYWLLLAVLLLAVLFIEASYVVDKFLFKVLIDKGSEFASGALNRESLISVLLTLTLIFGLAVLGRTVLKWFHLHLINHLDAELIVDLKRKFFNHILHLSYDFHTTHRTGSLISRLVRGGRAMEGMTDVIIFNMVPLLFQLFIVGGSLLYFSWVPAVITLAMAFTFIGYSLLIQQKQKWASVKANKAEDVEKAQVGDYLANIDPIKYFGKERVVKQRFAAVSNQTKLMALQHWGYFRWLDAGHSVILGVGIFFILLFPLRDFLEGQMTLGTLTFIYVIYGNLVFPLFGFVHGMKNFYQAMADFEALFQYGKIKTEIEDETRQKEFKIKKGSIEFRQVDFSYRKRKLFHQFSLKIPSQKRIALVGYSGCGKTTLVKLLYRFYDTDRGEILIDGKNIKEWKKESLRSELSIVPQDGVLFDDTIYHNIAFSHPTASHQKVIEAMRFAQLDQVVKDFPNKEHTIVGEKGVKLSGGEKQRVSIARAILADKKVLVLDEATSSLDSQTEHEIQADLKKLMRGRTCIIIAHRLSTIMNADLIVVLEKGRIVQMGRHRELSGQGGPYQKLWKLQKGGYLKF